MVMLFAVFIVFTSSAYVRDGDSTVIRAESDATAIVDERIAGEAVEGEGAEGANCFSTSHGSASKSTTPAESVVSAGLPKCSAYKKTEIQTRELRDTSFRRKRVK